MTDLRKLRRSIFIITLMLLGIGVIMVYSASAIFASEAMGSSFYFLRRHLIYIGIGLLLSIFVMKVDLRRIQDLARPILMISVVSLGLVLIPGIGSEAGGARRWFKFFNVGFQPAEFVKLAILVYISDYMARRGNDVKAYFRGFLPLTIVVGLISGLVLLQPDFGTAVSIAMISFLVIYAGGGKLQHIASLCIAAFPFLWFAVLRVPYRRSRITAFLDPWSVRKAEGFQVVQSFLALGTGGLFGVGLGKSSQKLFYLPAAHTDFIFAVIGEELGFLGAASVLILFFLLFWQGMRVVFKSRVPFARHLTFGITMMFAVEALVNIGVSTGSLPTKGLPLPFISYGGSSIVMHMMAVALLLSTARFEERFSGSAVGR
ncbi:MAG: putative lipid II flippase FtsW [Candidatus Omnitrophica bacterium]|nr:putative lipid II flippase FtsW [Candidatus Omnitrophota bacterium]